MLLGNVFLGMGVSIFKLSEMGIDPFSGMVMALAEVLGIGYPVFLILVNLVLLFVEVKFGREMIGAGTVVNACLLGYIVTFFYTIWVRMFGGVPQNFAVRLALVCIAIIVMSFGVSMYQTADVGVAPWDSLSLILIKRHHKLPYFGYRIIGDAIAVLVCWFAGGIIGIGTAVCAFGLGPVYFIFLIRIFPKSWWKSKESDATGTFRCPDKCPELNNRHKKPRRFAAAWKNFQAKS